LHNLELCILGRKKELLESDGISVEDDKVENFEKLFWDPSKELSS